MNTALQKISYRIEGVERHALVHLPAVNSSNPTPILFAFHGHGGTAERFARKQFEKYLPNIIVVYPQGLPTKSSSDSNGERNGWQRSIGEVNSHTHVKDQDVKFFDAMLRSFNTGKVFVHGWSNGGFFLYNVLWKLYGDKLAAIAPAASFGMNVLNRKPLPFLQIAGKHDPTVAFDKQQKSFDNVRKLNKCSAKSIEWTKRGDVYVGALYQSTIKCDSIFLQYDGTHAYPYMLAPVIADFFKQQL